MKLDAHKSAVARAYGLASDGYDKPALKFFSQGAESLVDFVGLSRGQKILDVASGTGHAAFYAGTKVGAPDGSVIGIDIAEEMVTLANAKADTLSGYNVRFASMDGEQTTFTDNEFDAVLCSYGIFFLPEMTNGIREWKRVAKAARPACSPRRGWRRQSRDRASAPPSLWRTGTAPARPEPARPGGADTRTR